MSAASHEAAKGAIGGGRIVGVGLAIGMLLNVTGWLGNNFVLKPWWREVGAGLADSAWRQSIWRDVFSFAPDLVYGVAIAWLCVALRPRYRAMIDAAWRAGAVVSVVGGLTTYFAIANSGFIPWRLAFGSFALVIATKMPLALLAGRWLERD